MAEYERRGERTRQREPLDNLVYRPGNHEDGFPATEEDTISCNYHHHVGVNAWNQRSEPADGRGLAWFEFVVPDEDALAGERRRLTDVGRIALIRRV